MPVIHADPAVDASGKVTGNVWVVTSGCCVREENLVADCHVTLSEVLL